MKRYIVGTHSKHLCKEFLMSTHNIYLWRNKKKLSYFSLKNVHIIQSHDQWQWRQRCLCCLLYIQVMNYHFTWHGLTLKAPSKICSRQHFEFFFTYYFLFFRENKSWHFMWIICLADDSHEMSRLYSLKKIKVKLFSAAVVIGTWRVKYHS